MEAGPGGCRGRAGLVREKDFQRRIGGRSCQGGNRVAALSRVKVMGAEVSHARNDQRGTIVVDHGVLVQENAQTEAPELGGPRSRTGVVFVIPRDEERTIASAQALQRRG